MTRCHIIRLLAMALMAVAMASCGSSKTVAVGGSKSTGRTPTVTPPSAHINLSGQFSAPTTALLREADSWIGTRYLYGGNDRDGVDCSGFVVQVFNNALSIKLPRTSLTLQQYCTPIEREQLQPGDLVFFGVRGGGTVGHVGIYVGDGLMVHSSSSKGVVVSSLENNYYKVNYLGSGRVDRYYAMVGSNNKPKSMPLATPTPKAAPVAAASVAAVEPSEPEETALDDLSEFFD